MSTQVKPVKEKGLYDWLSTDKDCPDDLVVNAGIQPIVVGAPASVENDAARIDVGDRRRGPFYVKLIGMPGMAVGLQRVKAVSAPRLAALEKIRRQRTGEIPADWIIEARRRADAGQTPTGLATPAGQMTDLQKIAAGIATD